MRSLLANPKKLATSMPPALRNCTASLRRSALGVSLALLALVTACQRQPADLREWKADDHDRAEESQKGQGGPARAAPPSSASASPDPNATLVEVTWRNQCASCHGAGGKGDGPQGPMVHAADLTRAEWQTSVSDEQIAATILNGKNRMPKFEFPAPVLRGLVARIRASRASAAH